MIFKELKAFFPNVGCPLALYMTKDSGYMAARRSEHAVWRAANEVASRADKEFVNKWQCIEAERKARHKQMLATNVTAPPSTKEKSEHGRSPIKPGQYALVAQDLLPGNFFVWWRCLGTCRSWHWS